MPNLQNSLEIFEMESQAGVDRLVKVASSRPRTLEASSMLSGKIAAFNVIVDILAGQKPSRGPSGGNLRSISRTPPATASPVRTSSPGSAPAPHIRPSGGPVRTAGPAIRAKKKGTSEPDEKAGGPGSGVYIRQASKMKQLSEKHGGTDTTKGTHYDNAAFHYRHADAIMKVGDVSRAKEAASKAAAFKRKGDKAESEG